MLTLLCSCVAGQLSDPIAGDHQVKSHKNKFLKRVATQDENQSLRCRLTTSLGVEQPPHLPDMSVHAVMRSQVTVFALRMYS